MSLMGTLAKVAVGIAVAKGAGALLKKDAGSSTTQSGGGLGDLMDQLTRGGQVGGQPYGQQQQQGSGGLDDLLGQIMGSGQPAGSGGGGLGDLLGGVLGGQGGRGGGQGGGAGGLGNLLGGLLGGAGAGGGQQGGAGGLGDLLGQFTNSGQQPSGPTGSFNDVFNQSLDRRGEPELNPTPQQEALAALMLRATIQAAKSDGRLDDNERDNLLKILDDISDEERRFVENEMAQPVDVDGLARQVPRGLESQIYTMSVMAIDLDSHNEAQYLHQLASKMGLNQNQVNAIHDELNVPHIYA